MEQEMDQIKRLQATKADRDDDAVRAVLAKLSAQAADSEINLMPTLIEAAHAYATEGEIMNTLADVFGRYTEQPFL